MQVFLLKYRAGYENFKQNAGSEVFTYLESNSKYVKNDYLRFMITRDAFKKLKYLATKFPAVAVVGPRQSGKTTLARMAFFTKSLDRTMTSSGPCV